MRAKLFDFVNIYITRGGLYLYPTIYFCSLNCRGLGKDSKLLLLDEQLGKIKWDIVALQETKRTGTTTLTTAAGSTIFCHSDNSIHGTGFVVPANRLTTVIRYNPISSRVSSLDMKINRQTTIRAISCYGPTTSASDDEYKCFLKDVHAVIKSCTGRTIPLLLGDFNAKIGCREQDETVVGPHSTGIRNERGQMLIEFLHSEHHRCWSTFFKKKLTRQWTWRSPNGRTTNTIDYIISPVKSALTYTDVTVMNSFDYDSDHRLLRAAISVPAAPRRPTHPLRGERHVSRALYCYGVSQGTTKSSQSADSIYRGIIDRLGTVYTVATAYRRTPPFLSDRTLHLLRKRRSLQNDKTARGIVEFNIASKAARSSRKEDVRTRRNKRLSAALRKGTNLKDALSTGKPTQNTIMNLRDKQGTLQHTQLGMSAVAKEFYEDLYRDNAAQHQQPTNTDTAAAFMVSEIRNAIRDVTTSTSPGPDTLSPDALKWASPFVEKEITEMFNICLQSGSIPDELLKSRTKLLFKKGDISDIANYRPISLLNSIYKVFSRCILRRIEKKMDAKLDESQTGFRKTYSTSDNIHSLRQLIEKTKEFRMPLFLCFVDIQKAFDRVQHSAIWNSLHSIGIDSQMINLLRSIYRSSKSTLNINGSDVPIDVQRGVRQGDVLSPQLFAIVLDHAISQLDWSTTGIRIDGQHLSHLLYADDAVLAAPNKRTLSRMVKEFSSACGSVGLNINIKKCEYIHNQNDSTPLRFNDIELKPQTYVTYLGVHISMPINWDKEISRRISSAWAAYNQYRGFMKTPSIPMSMKRKLFNTVILPRLTYGAESWSLSNASRDRLRVTQRKMERSMLNYRLQDRIPNATMRLITRLKDVCREAALIKFTFCSRIAQSPFERWSHKLTTWYPYNRKRCPGRPLCRWKDEMVAATINFSRTRTRGRVRMPPIRGEEFLRTSRDRATWQMIRDHHIATI